MIAQLFAEASQDSTSWPEAIMFVSLVVAAVFIFLAAMR